MSQFAQFGGNPCGGESSERRPCETTQGCPLQAGCGDRFRCRSGQCISMSLKCNGDQDCEKDNQDEVTCPADQVFDVCDIDQPPPNLENLGLGFDLVIGKSRGSVINTMSFGGQCRTIIIGDSRRRYRLPQNILKYVPEVTVRNDFSNEFFDSTWSYVKDIQKRETSTGTTTGFNNYNYKLTEQKTESNMLMILKNEIEIAQFQTTAPSFLTLSEEFWKALARLPNVYDYVSYSEVLERFGTHYRTGGKLGGTFEAIISLNKKTAKKIETESWSYNLCTKTKRSFLFIKWTTESCKKDSGSGILPNPPEFKKTDEVVNVHVNGGNANHIEGMKHLNLERPEENWRVYKDWADSLRSLPGVYNVQLAPLSDLVKEVQCAGVKRIYMRRAIDQYLAERHPCRCRPCQNNGLATRDGNNCKCICKPGTTGVACETGTDVQEQAGAIHGSWSCWSDWTSCTKGVRRRTRECTNPSPLKGGHHCIGEPAERDTCDDDLEDLKYMEPQCFDLSALAKEACKSPPSLRNGYVQYPRDQYLVGTTIEYTCIVGYYLVGEKTAECKSDKTWTTPSKYCKNSRCDPPSLSDDVKASVWQATYVIGHKVQLSCPQGRAVEGEKEIICDSSLNWSPNPQFIECSEELPEPLVPETTVKCKPWEREIDQACVCKAPNECPSSLEVCATDVKRQRTNVISVCKVHASQCMGMNVKLEENSACKWRDHTTTPCNNCQLWQTCNDQTGVCRCKDAAECVDPGLSVCVRVGDDAASQTMSECEAGRRRCNGEMVSVISILPC